MLGGIRLMTMTVNIGDMPKKYSSIITAITGLNRAKQKPPL